MTALLRIEETREGDVPVASLHGEIDASNAGDIGERLRSLVTNHLEAMVVDLSGVTYLDSAGINLLFALGDQLRGRQQKLAVVVSDGSPIARMIAITGLAHRVPVLGSLGDAVAHFG
jgi:anti-anti-sigma factor